MIPIPQYPLYNALITVKSGVPVGYFMEESGGSWQLSISEMQSSLDKAREKGVNVKSLVVINPGNPTGQVLSLDNLKRIVDFAHKNRLVLLADEVYQDNIYIAGQSFNSFRAVNESLKTNLELFSFHSLSKGFFGECGLRGGYMELCNIDTGAQSQILKLASIMLCSSTLGQIAMGLALDPPTESGPSYLKFQQEKAEILGSLQRKAKIMHEMLNSMDNIECNLVEGAMYAMPLVKFSSAALKEAENRGMPADKMYSLEALEATGIIIVPGSGFGQRPGTGHFRITILSPEANIRETLGRFKAFNDAFHRRFKD
jgi:alanine transaminase